MAHTKVTLHAQPYEYFDYEAFARDAELNGDVHEFEYAGQTYTTDHR